MYPRCSAHVSPVFSPCIPSLCMLPSWPSDLLFKRIRKRRNSGHNIWNQNKNIQFIHLFVFVFSPQKNIQPSPHMITGTRLDQPWSSLDSLALGPQPRSKLGTDLGSNPLFACANRIGCQASSSLALTWHPIRFARSNTGLDTKIKPRSWQI